MIFTGMVPHSEAPDYYRLGNLFVTASTSETQGLTYFEALAAGVPVLCRKDPCVEGVIENGVNGWQYEDAAGFMEALDIFCGSEARREEMGRAALASSERFSAEAFGEAVARLYQEVQRQWMPLAAGER